MAEVRARKSPSGWEQFAFVTSNASYGAHYPDSYARRQNGSWKTSNSENNRKVRTNVQQRNSAKSAQSTTSKLHTTEEHLPASNSVTQNGWKNHSFTNTELGLNSHTSTDNTSRLQNSLKHASQHNSHLDNVTNTSHGKVDGNEGEEEEGAGVRLPPLDPSQYMVAQRSHSDSFLLAPRFKQHPLNAPPPYTAPAKRFMQNQMSRFWKNIHSIPEEEGSNPQTVAPEAKTIRYSQSEGNEASNAQLAITRPIISTHELQYTHKEHSSSYMQPQINNGNMADVLILPDREPEPNIDLDSTPIPADDLDLEPETGDYHQEPASEVGMVFPTYTHSYPSTASSGSVTLPPTAQ